MSCYKKASAIILVLLLFLIPAAKRKRTDEDQFESEIHDMRDGLLDKASSSISSFFSAASPPSSGSSTESRFKDNFHGNNLNFQAGAPDELIVEGEENLMMNYQLNGQYGHQSQKKLKLFPIFNSNFEGASGDVRLDPGFLFTNDYSHHFWTDIKNLFFTKLALPSLEDISNGPTGRGKGRALVFMKENSGLKMLGIKQDVYSRFFYQQKPQEYVQKYDSLKASQRKLILDPRVSREVAHEPYQIVDPQLQGETRMKMKGKFNYDNVVFVQAVFFDGDFSNRFDVLQLTQLIEVDNYVGNHTFEREVDEFVTGRLERFENWKKLESFECEFKIRIWGSNYQHKKGRWIERLQDLSIKLVASESCSSIMPEPILLRGISLSNEDFLQLEADIFWFILLHFLFTALLIWKNSYARRSELGQYYRSFDLIFDGRFNTFRRRRHRRLRNTGFDEWFTSLPRETSGPPFYVQRISLVGALLCFFATLHQFLVMCWINNIYISSSQMIVTMAQYIAVFHQFRYVIVLVNVQAQTMFNDMHLRMRWEFKMHMLFFVCIFTFSYFSFQISFLDMHFIAGAYCSLWIPQIISNAVNGFKKTPQLSYCLILSAQIMFMPCYFRGQESNFIGFYPLDRGVFWSIILIWLVLIQIGSLKIQQTKPYFIRSFILNLFCLSHLNRRLLEQEEHRREDDDENSYYRYQRAFDDDAELAAIKTPASNELSDDDFRRPTCPTQDLSARTKKRKKLRRQECAICLGPIGEAPFGHVPTFFERTQGRREFMRTPCHHVYHKECLLRWMDEQGRLACPMCRRPLPEYWSL